MREVESRRSELYLQAVRGELPGKLSGLTASEYCATMTPGCKPNTARVWRTLIRHLDLSGIGPIPLAAITVQDCIRFRKYLLSSKMHQGSSSTNMSRFRTMLKKAFRDGVMKEDLRELFDGVKATRKRKIEYLTQEELDRLLSTPTGSGCRRPFAFGCLTGLRYSDLEALVWESIIDHKDGTSEIRYQVIKTSKHHTLPIGAQARRILGDRGSGKVFREIPTQRAYNLGLSIWASKAGINKRITSHVARHTFATLSMSKGVPLGVLRDLLAHSSVTETEIYAEVIPEMLRKHAGAVTTSAPIEEPMKLRLVR
jgi:integrase